MIHDLKLLHETRLAYDQARHLWEEKEAAFSEHNKTLLQTINYLREQIKFLDEGIRQEAIKTFAETGNKAPWPGVGIREKTSVAYDPKQAFEWATEHGLALRLDAPVFEQIMRANKADLPFFVRLEVTPQATIATDLGPYVGPHNAT